MFKKVIFVCLLSASVTSSSLYSMHEENTSKFKTCSIQSLQKLCAEYFSKKIDAKIGPSIEKSSVLLQKIQDEYFKGKIIDKSVHAYYAATRGIGALKQSSRHDFPIMKPLADGRYALVDGRYVSGNDIALLSKGNEDNRETYKYLKGHKSSPERAMWEIKPGYLISYSSLGKEIKLWSLKTGACLQTFEIANSWIWGCTSSF